MYFRPHYQAYQQQHPRGLAGVADEVKAGDTFSYSAYFTMPDTTPTTAMEVAGHVASRVGGSGMQASIEQAGGYGFELGVISLIDRARVADLKYNLDAASNDVLGSDFGRLANSSIALVSSVPRVPGQASVPDAVPNVPAGAPQPGFISGLAKSLGVSESNAWLILLGGVGAVVLMMKK